MADFQDAQKTLAEARRAQGMAEGDLIRANEQLKQVTSKLEQLNRRFDPNNPEHVKQRADLANQSQRLAGAQKESEAALGKINSDLAGLAPAFWEKWADPRQHAGKMSDNIPVMLFPLRIETRFKSIGTGAGEQKQLWVRVYPDDCLVDTFEETLSQSEVDSARIFWREYFRAAGVEDEERAAWRGLVASHGSGRAAWIIKNYRPKNPLEPSDPLGDPSLEDKPQSKTPADVILVVTAGKDLKTAEKAPLGAYWAAFWRAGGQSGPETAALAQLNSDVRSESRAAELIKQFQPYNLAEKPPQKFTRVTAKVRVSFLYMPGNEETETKSTSWTKAAKADLLPDRFVLLGYRQDQDGWKEILNELGQPVQTPFSVSPDPSSDTESQFKFDDHGNLTVGDDLRWVLDFDEAVRRGMGFRVNLTPQQAAGFDRLFVLGIRLTSDAMQGKAELETLFQNQYFSRTGFALLPQGTPTNNTEDGNSAYSRADDADDSYDFVFKGKSRFGETGDWLTKCDGQWFAESLGLDTEWLKQVPHAGGQDQCEARAMNTALWPTTLGYFMDTLLKPVFSDDDIYYTRWFFNRFVTGRGLIPAIRIGRQPYGILPTSAYSRISWVSDKVSAPYRNSLELLERRRKPFNVWLPQFKAVLDQLRITWLYLAQSASHVGSTGKDPHQTLLDVVGLHPASVEFHQRYASTKKQEHNIAMVRGRPIYWPELPANELHDQALALLGQLGYAGEEQPTLFDLFWKVSAQPLNGPVIQEGPLSEFETLRKITTNDKNYIEWLHEWARLSFDTIRVQDGFNNGTPPNTLLYILLRNALELGYHDAGIRVMAEAQLLSELEIRALRSEPHFFHIPTARQAGGIAGADGTAEEQSRYKILYSPDQRITGDARRRLVEHITLNLDALHGARYLSEHLRALEQIQNSSTARLERALAEHLDCSSYRLDAWITGLIDFQLTSMRFPSRDNPVAGADATGGTNKGIYLGAYGWLENVRPANKALSPVSLRDKTLNEIFNTQVPDNQRAPLLRDVKNEGYIHAPSVNHAITAAILRNGYISNATPENPEMLKVNLSSERVRGALGIIEGIRNGQNLGALLGYQFERGLHDRYGMVECDKFIYPLRLLFPLVTQADNLPDGVSIEAVEARNVVNGLTFIRHIKNAAPAHQAYPFGYPDKLPSANDLQKGVINAEVDRLLNLYDAVADLAIAESVHQVVMGNYDGAAATLDAYGQATFPPLPDVVQTPRSGIGLTHRVGLHFETNVPVNASDNPRVKAEPAMNKWLGKMLPLPASVSCKVIYADPATGNPNTIFVTQANLGLQALDLLYIFNPDNLQARSEFEDRIRDYVLESGAPPRPDVSMEITYTECDTGHFSFFELAPMLRSLRALFLRSRPLRATDVALPTEASTNSGGGVVLDPGRVSFLTATSSLPDVKTNILLPLLTTLNTLLPKPEEDLVTISAPAKATVLANIDNYFSVIVDVCKTLALYGVQQTGFGIYFETRSAIFKALIQKASDLVARWDQKLVEYDAVMSGYSGLASEPEKIALLLRAERAISTTFTDSTGKLSQVKSEVEAKKALFKNRNDAFDNFTRTNKIRLSEALSDFKLLLPTAAFDLQKIDADDIEKQILILASDIRTRAKHLADALDKLVLAVDSKLTESSGVSSPDEKSRLLIEAAKLVFGEEFVVVPSFTLPDSQAEELAKAYAGREQLLDYQRNERKNEFAVDDWIYGVARVREKMHHLENLLFLGDAFNTFAPELRPVQLPFEATAPWLALELPQYAKATPEWKDLKKIRERENLLYSASYPDGFDLGQPQQCGLLIDEWTEVIPSETETTGVAFHFDKPNAEPPQSILLVTPPQFTGAWKWDDLVATLHETLDMARVRAVEPQQLDQTALSVFLPATTLATTWQPITIGADLSTINKFFIQMPKVQ